MQTQFRLYAISKNGCAPLRHSPTIVADIFFGVHDLDTQGQGAENKSYAATGMDGDAFQKADGFEITRVIKGVLDPTPDSGNHLPENWHSNHRRDACRAASQPPGHHCAMLMAMSLKRATFSSDTQAALSASNTAIFGQS